MEKVRLAILASGSGSNAEGLWRRFDADHPFAEVVYIGCNRPPARAGIYDRAEKAGRKAERFSREDLEGGALRGRLENLAVDWILLAGFLMKIPAEFIQGWPDRILNIHPSLLPRFGGAGMWGMNVHEAVHAAALEDESLRESGMTIHRVNEKYDEGEIVFQAATAIDPVQDQPEDIAARVLELEHRYYPEVVEHLIKDGK
jgi:phosphoribosylglycinamide formyltransferase-1